MSNNQSEGMFRYEDVEGDYLQRRQLRRSAGWVLLWALGVGGVIAGDFSGWNIGLSVGGFGGLAIATFLMAAMYVCMVASIAELSAALPHAGGFFSFTRNAFGPLGGYICGVTDTIEYVITPAVIVYFIGAYMQTLLPIMPVPFWWVLFYAVFVLINIRGVELTLKAGLVITAIAASLLLFFGVSVIFSGKFDGALLFNIAPEAGNPVWLPFGWMGVFKSLPYAIWFYLAIEQLPLAAEEAHDTVRDIPKALTWGITTLLALSLLVLVLNPGLAATTLDTATGQVVLDATTQQPLVGAAAMAVSGAPIADGFKAIFGEGAIFTLLTTAAIAGLIASFHTITYAYGRVLFSLSRAGYYPRWISIVSPWHTPATALIVGALIGLTCITTLVLMGKENLIGGAMLNMAVSGAVLSYFLVMISYIRIKLTRPELKRPYLSPLGIPGAALGATLSGLALLACFANPDYQGSVVSVLIFLAVMVLYFLFYARHRLVERAPEEENAYLAEAMAEIEHADGLEMSK